MSLHIHRVPTEVTHNESEGERWCFNCRARHEFQFIILTPTDPMSCYGPTPLIRCSNCQQADADLFPGRFREWPELL